jgi:hypothetical protein
MRTPLSHLTAALLATALAGGSTALAQQAPAPSFEDLSQPTAEATPQPEYVKAIARSAYLWGWPMVNMLNRRVRITQAPEPGLLGGVLPVAPRGQIGMLHDYIEPSERFVVCPNQDVVYGLGFFDLDTEPVVVQVPDFGDRFWVYALYDQRTDQFGELGKPYGSAPGFYLLAGPNWDGDVPDGISAVIRSSTSLANAVPRVFMNDTDEDRKAIQPVIDQIVAYPLSDFDGEMKTIDWSEAPSIPAPDQQGEAETRWVVPEKFFDQLPEVLEMVPPLPGEEALYAQFRWLMDVAASDPDLKQAIVDEAVATEQEVIDPFFEWAAQRQARGQWLEPLGEQCGVGRRLLRPHRHGQVQHVRQQAERDPVLLHRQRLVRRAARRLEDLRRHLPRRGGAARQRLLVADALQRASLLLPQRPRPLFARHQEPDPAAQPGRLADALRRGHLPGRR